MWLSLKSPATEVRVVPKHHRFSCAWADPSASSAAIAVEAVVVMEGNLDDLMRFLLEEIALCGQQGALPSLVLTFIDQHFAKQRECLSIALQPAHSSQQEDEAVHTIDRPYQEQVWRWLTRHPEVRVGQNGEGNGMSLADVENYNMKSQTLTNQGESSASVTTSASDVPVAEVGPSLYVDRDAASEGGGRFIGILGSRSPHSPATRDVYTETAILHVFTSEDRMWYAAAGHGPDNDKIAYLEFVCLSIIASQRKRGILQPELVRISGQDKRSVPVRTQNLCDKGYIVKKHVLAAGSRTSLCILKRFADQTTVDEDLHDVSLPEQNATATENHNDSADIPDSNVEQLEPLIRSMFSILKEVRIITWDDLKKNLGVWRNTRVSRYLAVSVRKLEYLECVRRVRAPGNIPKFGGDLHKCIKFLREPVEKDWQYFFDMKRNLKETGLTEGQNADNNGEESFDTDYNADHSTQVAVDTIPNEVQNKHLLWTPDRLMVNILRTAIQSSGTNGMSSMDIKDFVVGKFLERPIEQLLGRVVEVWQLSQPPHLRRLAILRDTTVTGKLAHYVYYAYDIFKSMVEAGSASWEAVETIKAAKLDAEVSKVDIHAIPNVDRYGFSKLDPTRFQSRRNDATLAECFLAADIEPEGRTIHRSSTITHNNGISPTIPKPRRPKGRPRKYPKFDLPTNASELTMDQLSTLETSRKRAREYEQTKISKAIASRVAAGEQETKATEDVLAEVAACNKENEDIAMVVPLNITIKPRKKTNSRAKNRKPHQASPSFLPLVAADISASHAGDFAAATMTATYRVLTAPRKRLYRSRRFDSAIGYFPSTLAHMPPSFGLFREVAKLPIKRKACRTKPIGVILGYLPSVAAHSFLDYSRMEANSLYRGPSHPVEGQSEFPLDLVNTSQHEARLTLVTPVFNSRKRSANDEAQSLPQLSRKRSRLSQLTLPRNTSSQAYEATVTAPYLPSTAAHTLTSFEVDTPLSRKAFNTSKPARARRKTAKATESEFLVQAVDRGIKSKVGDLTRPKLTYEEQRDLILHPTTGVRVGVLVDYKSASGRGRPRKSRLAVLKSQRLLNFSWFGPRLSPSEATTLAPASIATFGAPDTVIHPLLDVEGPVSPLLSSAGIAISAIPQTNIVQGKESSSAPNPGLDTPRATSSHRLGEDNLPDVRAVFCKSKTPPVNSASPSPGSIGTLPRSAGTQGGRKRRRTPPLMASRQPSLASISTDDGNGTSPTAKRRCLEQHYLSWEARQSQGGLYLTSDDLQDMRYGRLACLREGPQEMKSADRPEPQPASTITQAPFLNNDVRPVPTVNTTQASRHGFASVKESLMSTFVFEKVGQAQEVGTTSSQSVDQAKNDTVALTDDTVIGQNTAHFVLEQEQALYTIDAEHIEENHAYNIAATLVTPGSDHRGETTNTATLSEGSLSDRVPCDLTTPISASNSAVPGTLERFAQNSIANVRVILEPDSPIKAILASSEATLASHENHEESQDCGAETSLTPQSTPSFVECSERDANQPRQTTNSDLAPLELGLDHINHANEPAQALENNGPAPRITKVTPHGGSMAILRRKIIMDIITQCGGVFPGDAEIWTPFSETWMSRSDAGKPDRKTVLAAMKHLIDMGKLRKLSFTFKNYVGIATTKSIVTFIDIAPTDPKVKYLQKKIAEQSSRVMYIPEEANVFRTQSPGRLQKKAAWQVSKKGNATQAWPKVLDIEEEQVKIQHVPERLQRNPGKTRFPTKVSSLTHSMDQTRTSREKKAKQKEERLLQELEEALGELGEPDFAIPDYRHSEAMITSEDAGLSTFRWRDSRRSVASESEARIRRLSELPKPARMYGNSVTTRTHTMPSSGRRLMRLSSKPVAVSHHVTANRYLDDLEGDVDAFLKSRPHSCSAYKNQDTHLGNDMEQHFDDQTSHTPAAIVMDRAVSTYLTTTQIRFVDVLGLHSNFDMDSHADPEESEAQEGQRPFVDRTLDRLEPPGNGDRLDRAPGNGQTRSRQRKSPTDTLQKTMEKQLHEIRRQYESLSQKPGWNRKRARRQRRIPTALSGTGEQASSLMDPDHVFNVSTGTFSTRYNGIPNAGDISNFAVASMGHTCHRQNELTLPKNLEDILLRIKSVTNSFFEQVDSVRKWELDAPILAHRLSQDWNFINFRLQGPAKAAFDASYSIAHGKGSAMHVFKRTPKRSYRRKLTSTAPSAELSIQRTAAISRSKTRGITWLGETATSKAREPTEELSDADGRVSKRIRLRGPKLRITSPDDDRRIMIAVIVVRILVGGIEQHIDWVLLSRMFAPKYSETVIHHRWVFMRERHKAVIERLQVDFQEIFVQAYEQGVVPPLNFDDYDDYDWNWLLNWTVENLDAQMNLVTDLPESRKTLDCHFELRELPMKDIAEFYEIDLVAPIPRRRIVISQSPYVLPLAGSASLDIAPGRIEIAKTWVRANLITADHTYDPKFAREKLMSIGERTVEVAVQELMTSKVIVRDSKRRLHQGRNYDISEQCLSHLRKKLERGHFRQAAAYKKYLDDQFKVDGVANFSWNAADGEAMAVLNLAANGRIRIVPKNPPIEKFGLVDNGYRTRHMDRKRLHFDIELRPTTSYVIANPILPLPPPPGPAASVYPSDVRPRLRPGGTMFGDAGNLPRLPSWIDINCKAVFVMWELALAAVVGIMALRPGVSAREVEVSVRPSLEAWEIRSIMSWCVQAGIASWACEDDGQSENGGVRLKEWWWMLFGGMEEGTEAKAASK